MHKQSHMLENEKIGKLLLKLSLPAAVGMIVNSLYNIIDTVFIGRGIGYLAIGGLTVAFPIQMLIMSLAQMIGIGAASAISRSLGAKDIERANHTAGNSFLAVGILGLFICILGLIFVDPILRIFGATDILLPYAREYIQIILIGSTYFSFVMSTNNLIRAEGNAKTAMFTMVIGAILNIFLDYIFIFPLNMGIRGAALATILSQFVSLIYVLVYMYSGKSSLRVKLYHLKPDLSILYEIFAVGLPAFARQVGGSFVAIILNRSLIFYGGELAISVFGVINRVMMFLFMPLMGISQGMQPIAGYNYGAGRIDRVNEVVRLSIIATTVFATIGTLIGELFPHFIIGLFSDEQELIKSGAYAVRIVISLVPLIGAQLVGSTLFQALGKALPSLILSLLRQVILLIPLVLIIPRIYNLGLLGIWLAIPLTDLLSIAITVMLLKREMIKINKQTPAF